MFDDCSEGNDAVVTSGKSHSDRPISGGWRSTSCEARRGGAGSSSEMQSKGESAASGSARNQPRLLPMHRPQAKTTRQVPYSNETAKMARDKQIHRLDRTHPAPARCMRSRHVSPGSTQRPGEWPLARDIALRTLSTDRTHRISLSTGLYLLVCSPPSPPPLSRSSSRLPRPSRALLPSVYLQSLYSPSACTKPRRQAGSAGTTALAEASRSSPSPAPSASAPRPALSASRTALDESCATWLGLGLGLG